MVLLRRGLDRQNLSSLSYFLEFKYVALFFSSDDPIIEASPLLLLSSYSSQR
jgi:hypothetical protein